MEANTRQLERIFESTISYQIPLFQRPYVWKRDENWEPLWEDIQALLDKHLRGAKVHPHFLGAVVLEQLASPTGSIESRQVIDGQQRFTTLQVFLLAGRDHAQRNGASKYVDRLGDLVANRRSKIDNDYEVFKVWPTNGDREAFRLVHEAQSPAGLDRSLAAHADANLGSHNVVAAYRYFHDQLGAWLGGKLDDSDDAAALEARSVEDRLETLWQVVRAHLQVVVIDLDKDDETQVIFETLNARGEDLLPADLIKNYLFRRCVAAGDNVEKLYDLYWKGFETKHWREEVKQGRLKRPRIDTYIQHYLTLMTGDDVKASHLFNEFKSFESQGAPLIGATVPFPRTPAAHIRQLADYAAVFRTFEGTSGATRLGTFLRRLDALDTTTVYPFLLHSCKELLAGRRDELDAILVLLESFLVRRLLCGLTPKNYNRLFVDLIRATDKAGGVSYESVANHFRQSTGESTRLPSDEDVKKALCSQPLYGRIAQYKLRMILEALDQQAQTPKSEVQPLPDGLTIEHVMPQAWEAHWPIPSHIESDAVAKMKFTERRDLLVNTLGNLTLITGSLNPALSNGAWADKRPELKKFSKLNLTQYFHEKSADTWDEDAIEARTTYLFEAAKKVWPAL